MPLPGLSTVCKVRRYSRQIRIGSPFRRQEKTSDEETARDVDCLRVRRYRVRAGPEVGHGAQSAGRDRSQERRHPGAEGQGRKESHDRQSQGREKSQGEGQRQGEERRSQEVRFATRRIARRKAGLFLAILDLTSAGGCSLSVWSKPRSQFPLLPKMPWRK